MRVSMLFIATAFVVGAGTAPSWAESPSNDATLCRAIGLESDQRERCTQDMTLAMSEEDKDTVAAKWVAVSPLSSGSSQSLFKPPVDGNAKNGNPGTVYKDKVRNVPNQVTARIYRALKMNDPTF